MAILGYRKAFCLPTGLGVGLVEQVEDVNLALLDALNPLAQVAQQLVAFD